jgi:hypothetical protein
MHRDADLQKAFRERFLAPRQELVTNVYARAVERGEIGPGVDIELLSVTLPAVVIHHAYILGVEPTDDLILRVIDHVILPAARGSQAS